MLLNFKGHMTLKFCYFESQQMAEINQNETAVSRNISVTHVSDRVYYVTIRSDGLYFLRLQLEKHIIDSDIYYELI